MGEIMYETASQTPWNRNQSDELERPPDADVETHRAFWAAVGRAEDGRHKVYIFGSENAAEVFRMTVAAILGYAPERIGSVLVMSSADYTEICVKTYATPAAIVAELSRE